MKIKTVLGIALSLVWLSLLCGAQVAQYQAGKIVSIHQVQADSDSRHQAETEKSDAPLKGDPLKKYEVVVDAGGTLYTCDYLAHSDPIWSQGQEVKVRVEEKTLHIEKPGGKDEKLGIVRSTGKR